MRRRRHRQPRVAAWHLVPLGVVVVLLLATSVGHTAANVVPETRVADRSAAAGPNELKPNDCASIILTAKLSGSGANVAGSSAAELITGSAGWDILKGGPGDDCLVSGAGDDDLAGGPDIDVCIGGPGTDTFDQTCETQIQ